MSADQDIIVFGATGFTGRLAARRLAEDKNLRLGIAGRKRDQLEKIAASCRHRPEIIIADANDPQSIKKMVAAGRVIANFAGPFALYAEAVIAAVSEQGKSYCDITGETPFVRKMIDRYDELARQQQACLLPLSGFDSVPADLLSYQALQKAQQKAWQIDHLTHFYQIKGGLNGGTLASALNMAESGQSQLLQDSNILIPDPNWESQAPQNNQAAFEPLLQRWSLPFFMHPINAALVRRSLYLKNPKQKEIARISYEERLLLSRSQGAMQAKLAAATLASLSILTDYKIGRSLLRKFGPKPGQGPSEKVRKEGFYRGTMIAREDGKARLKVTMEAHGDPGNELTVLFATEIAKLLLEGKQQTQGFSTPTRAFADELIQRLELAGVRFNLEEIADEDHE